MENNPFNNGDTHTTHTQPNFIKKFGDIRQFSTETQTDLESWPTQFSWEHIQGDHDLDDLELPGVENLLSNMETQETQTHEDLLLLTNTCTQTQTTRSTPTRTANTESQTSLTGLFQPNTQIPPQDGVSSVDVQLMTDLLF